MLAARGARLVADPVVARGGCLVESDIGTIDASVETRWRRAAAALGCDEAWDAAPMPPAGADAIAARCTPSRRSPPVTERWQRYLADLQRFAAAAVPLEAQGLLVRVTGLVLEAAGIRVPVGSVCEVRMAGPAAGAGRSGRLLRRPRLPDADRRRARPGQRRPRRAAAARRSCRCSWARARHPWRRNEDRTLHLPVGDGLLGRVVDSHGAADGPPGPARRRRTTSR